MASAPWRQYAMPFWLVFACIGAVNAVGVEDMIARAEAEREERLEKRTLKQLDLLSGASGDQADRDLSKLADSIAKKVPPRSKQISVKRARAFMQEFTAALTTEEAKAEIETARVKADVQHPRVDDDDEEAMTPESSTLLAVGPIVDKFGRGVILKYDFEGGFPQAIASVTDAMNRKGDAQLKSLVSVVADMLAPVNPNKVSELSSLAVKFASMDAEQKEAAIEQARKLREEANDETLRRKVDEYLASMRGVLADGDSYIKEQIIHLVENTRELEKREQRASTAEEQALFNVRYDILSDFLTPTQMTEVEDTLSSRAASRSEL
eukprot:TRINITY_DN35560_c0_g1_i1.p1 TRINITY_DN35560_c0_g1~~TRINITY_DN35560_c0_g1_i1.p1  ORF type:complete len:323 (+),score=74.91 TRINITY_DN35560_c0_g1_i1:55-1023(+)